MDTEATHIVNPFTPVFGKIPPYMAGRASLIDEIVQAFTAEAWDPNLASIIVGARGTGKTALLSYLSREAQQSGWVVANVTADSGMLEEVYLQARKAASHLIAPEKSARLTNVSAAGIVSVGWERVDSSSTWRLRMESLIDELVEHGARLLITVDEVDPSLSEMAQLVTTYQHFVRDDRPVALLLAGLPHNVSGLLSGKTTSFLRRAARHDLGVIDDFEVAEAFRLTIEQAGKSIAPDALDAAVKAIGGFPYMFQLVGFRAWRESLDGPVIECGHVERGVATARRELRERVFDATFNELSPGDVRFLEAMAQGGTDVVTQAELGERLGKSSGYVSQYKRRLLEAGVVDELTKGKLAFALPGFGDYLADKLE